MKINPMPNFPSAHRLVSLASPTVLACLLVSCATPPAVEVPKLVVKQIAPVPEPVRAVGPPVAPVRNVSETFFGQVVVDPYRYLEDVNNTEVIAYMRAQGELDRKSVV